MRLKEILQIAMDYSKVAIILIAIVALVYSLGYFIAYKKNKNRTLKIKKKNILKWGLLFIYGIVVLGATIGIRHGVVGSHASLKLFYSYREAWYDFSWGGWRTIILNILMFVPLGIMLPLMFEKCRSFATTYLTGFFITLVIEGLQFVTGRGIFDIDDIFNNTLGCMIGYGIIIAIISLLSRKRKIYSKKAIAIMQIPLLATCIAFLSIFFVYSKQDLGNIREAFNAGIDMKDIEVIGKKDFDKESSTARIYKVGVLTEEEAAKKAGEIFEAVGDKIDETYNDVYDNTIVFYNTDRSSSIWINFKGPRISYNGSYSGTENGKENLTLAEIQALMSKFDITIPNNAEFKDEGSGRYSIMADMINQEGSIINGGLECSVSPEGQISEFDYDMFKLEPYKECKIISESDAYNKILEGRFNCYIPEDLNKIDIKDVRLDYTIDSKGYYQPVYVFSVEYPESSYEISVSALK